MPARPAQPRKKPQPQSSTESDSTRKASALRGLFVWFGCGRMGAMAAVDVQQYLAKAEDFLDGMKLLAGSVDHRTSMALLAVHSAISYGDALWIGLGNESTARKDHRTRRSELEALLKKLRYDDVQGLRHLENLISNKTRIAYSADQLHEKMAADMTRHAERFAIWANRTGVALGVDGWR